MLNIYNTGKYQLKSSKLVSTYMYNLSMYNVYICNVYLFFYVCITVLSSYLYITFSYYSMLNIYNTGKNQLLLSKLVSSYVYIYFYVICIVFDYVYFIYLCLIFLIKFTISIFLNLLIILNRKLILNILYYFSVNNLYFPFKINLN